MLDARGLPAGPHHRIMSFYKKDLIDYLSRVRGPKPFAMTLKPFPRPTGAATRVVVVEYDAPAGRGGGVAKLDPASGRITYLSQSEGKTFSAPLTPNANEYRSGSDWRLGTRSENREGGRHDIAVASDGHIYYGGSNMEGDPKGENIWFGSREFMKLDVKTQTIEQLAPSPVTMTHGKNVDSKGNLWASTVDGAVRLNLATKQITEFKTPTPHSRPYDMAIDGHDNVWLSLIAIDKMGVVDGRTGDVKEIPLQPYTSPDLRPEDYDLAKRVGSWDWTAPLMQLGPRRLGARGDHAWVGLFWTGGLAKLDARAKTLLKQYDVPNGRWIHPYKVLVDKRGSVWFGNANADLVGMFNPQTEQFTMYPLPTRGSNVRHLAIDDTTDPPTIWLPYISAQKIARLQVRPAPGR
jgi:streptogramin lyase